MEEKAIFTSDIHGNERQYKALVEYTLETKPSVLIIGGDLAPKGKSDDYIRMQGDFLRQRLPELVKPIKKQLPNTQIYLIPGNDDCKVNDYLLDEHPELYTNIDAKRVKIPGGLEIVGYSNVPITPFGLKDREKFDLTDVTEDVAKEYFDRVRATYNPDGLKSENQDSPRFRIFKFREQDKVDSIQKDLENKIFTNNPGKTIYVFHTPINNTPLDIINNGMHVGSFATRQFIEKHQPYLTLHGHIHETVKMSGGVYKNKIGNSLGMSAGNHNEENKLSILEFDLQNLEDVKRRRLQCN